MSVDPEMLKILQNLNNAQQLHEDKITARAEGREVVSEDSKEMYNILKKLEEATEKTATKIASEKDTDPVTAVGSITNSTVSMSGYNVVMEKRYLTENYKKTYYDITSGGKLLYKDIALFETAMTILKSLIDGNQTKIKKLLELDGRYASYLSEAAYHKQRSKTINESVKKDVAIAKQGAAMDKASAVKREIKRYI
jgi:hypothetical protein